MGDLALDLTENLARAFFDLCHDENIDTIVRDELSEIDRAFCKNGDIVNLLDSPGISSSERQSIVCDILVGAHAYTINLMCILTADRIVSSFTKVVSLYNSYYETAHGIEHVAAITAAPMTEDQIKRLKSVLENKRKKTIILENKVDRTLIGGIVLKYPDMQTNASVSSELDRVKRELLV